MKTKLLVMALAGIVLVPVVAVRAQTGPGPFDDLLNTWVLFENPEGAPPIPIDMTQMDLSPDPIPADFFGPGSDPFGGVIVLRGLHDGTQPGNTDTIVRRQIDPILPTDPPGTTRTIETEMVSLSLTSSEPIVVTGGNWQVDSFFDVFVELSPTVPSLGQLTATKMHGNGGSFDSFFDIRYRMTFTNVNDPTDVHVFDSGLAGQPPLRLEIRGAPWVHQVLIPELIIDPASQFHPFVQDDGTGQQTEAPVGAQTPLGAAGPIVIHTICLPKNVPVCIYQMGCKAAPPGDLVSCPSCPFNCKLYQGARCPNGSCAMGMSTLCGVTQCCLDFTLVACRAPLGEPPLPPLTAACACNPVLGACCNAADGTCTETTECECVGSWEGPGTTCGPVQGCCLPDGSCLDGVPQICCEKDLGGVSTPGFCSGILGKCCLDDGTCTDGVDQLCCAGSWIPGGVCLPPEECCFGLQCITMDPECCAALGGSPGGAGSACDPVQKCCFSDGTCANVEPDCCIKALGTPGAGLCQTPQACCLPDDTCVELDPDCCAQQGGVSHPGPCQPLQACCDPLTLACRMLEPRCCVDSGGTPEGAGTTCGPTGACCWDSDADGIIDMCQSNVAKECCNDFLTSVFHAGVDCAPVGACCFDGDFDGTNESCTQISETCCADLPGGTFNGAGSVCLGDLNSNGIDDTCESGGGGNCPLANSWCQSLVTDCAGGAVGDQCWPKHLHVTNQQFPIIDQCGCFGNTCGPIDIQSIGVPPMDYSIRCVNSCPTPGEACVIHYNGLPTSFSGVLASQIPIWVDVSCGCPSGTTDTCPLPPDIGIPDPCKDLQLTDCQNGTAADVCLPKVVVITSSGIPIAKTCSCFTPGPECGPPTITGDVVSCQGTCPAPQTGVCVVHADGVSTHMVSVHMGDVPVGANLTCGCSDPLPTDCRPNADATACDPVNCPVAGDSCRPKCMSVDPLTGAVSVVDCDCVGLDECHAEIDPLTVLPACVGSCPVGQHCEETTTTDPVTGVVTVCCNCVDNTVCAPTADGLACEQTVCADPSQICLPNVIAVNPLTGQVMVIDCDCVDPDACHVEFDAAQQPFCKGVCPPGETCELSTITSDDGTVAYTCDCVPVQTECAPNDIGSDCLPTVCPYPNEICRPTVISWSSTSPPVIKNCDCVDPEKQCHVEFDAATGPFCVGICPPGETCQLFGIDTDSDGELDLWSCDCVPINVECGPDPTQTYCNPATCPAADEFCVPIVIEIDPVNGQVRVVECECVSHGTGGSCHVNYDPTTLIPFCEGDCPPGQICTLFGKDVNGDGTNDQFHCDCVPDTIDCGPTPDGLACNPIVCPDSTQTCTPKVIQVLPGTIVPVVLVCDCIDPVADCHVEFNAAQGPHCVGDCPPGQTCELRSIDTDNDGQPDTFGCDCVPDTGTVCEPNATATDCKQTVCPIPGEICRPVLVTIGSNGQTKVVKCDCVKPDLDCHVEFDAANAPYCAGSCPPGETCELLGLDINNDGIDDLFKCECVPPTLECQPDSTGLDCKPTICPIPGDICRPKVMHWILGVIPVVQECECVGPDECHIEFDAAAQQPFCTGGCPPGEECKLSAKDSDNDGILDYWECLCVPPSVECSPNADNSACKDTVCPVAGEICLPSIVGLLGGFPIVEACDCVSPNACHLEFDAATGPVCVGECPPGKICKLFGFIDAVGLDHYLCKCIPDDTVCQPTADGQTCSQAACPVVGEKCVPSHVSCLPGAACVVSQCDCGDPTQCHVNLAPPNTNPPAICEGACPPGFACVLRRTDTNSDGIPDDFQCDCIVKPIVVAVDISVLKSRFFSIVRPGGVAAVANEAIRLRAVSIDAFPAFNGEVRWLGAPQDFPEENSAMPGLTFKGSRLECDPLFRDWSADGVVQVYGGMLVPNSEYVIQAVDISCPDLDDENCYSDVATVLTGKFGDIVDPFFVNPGDIQPDFKDISAAVAKFLGAPSAPIKARVQQQPNTPFPQRSVDFKDINFVVRAFLGEAYADTPGISGPCACPSTVTCGATACVSDTVCNGGLCVDGFCRDACQHCTP